MEEFKVSERMSEEENKENKVRERMSEEENKENKVREKMMEEEDKVREKMMEEEDKVRAKTMEEEEPEPQDKEFDEFMKELDDWLSRGCGECVACKGTWRRLLGYLTAPPEMGWEWARSFLMLAQVSHEGEMKNRTPMDPEKCPVDAEELSQALIRLFSPES